MRKSFLLILACCLFSNLMHAQFEVQSTGYSISNNITMDGVIGNALGMDGVVTVKSNKIDPKYNSFLGFGLGLIRTDCEGFKNVYPYSNINSNKSFSKWYGHCPTVRKASFIPTWFRC